MQLKLPFSHLAGCPCATFIGIDNFDNFNFKCPWSCVSLCTNFLCSFSDFVRSSRVSILVEDRADS